MERPCLPAYCVYLFGCSCMWVPVCPEPLLPRLHSELRCCMRPRCVWLWQLYVPVPTPRQWSRAVALLCHYLHTTIVDGVMLARWRDAPLRGWVSTCLAVAVVDLRCFLGPRCRLAIAIALRVLPPSHVGSVTDAEAPLLEGWVEYVDITSERPMWFNAATRGTSWLRPTHASPPVARGEWMQMWYVTPAWRWSLCAQLQLRCRAFVCLFVCLFNCFTAHAKSA